MKWPKRPFEPIYTHCIFVSFSSFFSFILFRKTVTPMLDNLVDNELYLGFREIFNTTHKDCVWRNAFKDRKLCNDEVKIWLYSNGSEELVRCKKKKHKTVSSIPNISQSSHTKYLSHSLLSLFISFSVLFFSLCSLSRLFTIKHTQYAPLYTLC